MESPTAKVEAGTELPHPADEITEEWCAHHFNHLDPKLAASIPEALETLRTQCPVTHSDQWDGFWVVSKYEDVLHILQDWETFSSELGFTVPSQPPSNIRILPLAIDPPLQRTFKRLINPFLTPAVVAHYEAPVRARVTQLIDDFVESGACEFMAAFARPFPALTFFELVLHAPSDELTELNRLATTAANPSDPESRPAMGVIIDWIRAFIEQRRHEPARGDVVDAVLHADIDGRPITEDEIIGTIQLLIFGGLDTTAGALGHIMLRFCREPEIPALLRRRPELIPDAVEELLRIDSPLVFMGRTATRDVEVGGQAIKAGDKVLISYLSANLDEAEFPNAASFNLERGRNRHIGFGAGVHRCAGSNLARLNVRVALEEMLSRLDDLRFQDPDEPPHLHSAFARAPETLRIAFTPGTRVDAPAATR